MRSLVSVVYVLALVMQLGGAGFVIVDVVRNTTAMRKFIATWQEIDGTPRDWPEIRQKALADLATARNINPWLRWTPVGFLIAGVILGFVGNELSLHVPAAPPAPVAPVSPSAT